MIRKVYLPLFGGHPKRDLNKVRSLVMRKRPKTIQDSRTFVGVPLLGVDIHELQLLWDVGKTMVL